MKIVLVTGGNRGIGFEICLQLSLTGHNVIMTARDEEKGNQAILELEKKSTNLDFYPLDVTDSKSITQAFAFIKEKIIFRVIKKGIEFL